MHFRTFAKLEVNVFLSIKDNKMNKTNERNNYIRSATAILRTAINEIDRLGAESVTTSTDVGLS